MNLVQNLSATLYARPLREQKMLFLGGLAILLLLAWQLLLAPVNGLRDRAQKQLNQSRAVYAEVDQLAARVQAARTQGQQQKPSGSMTEQIDASLRKQGLSIRGIQPGQQGELFVRLEAAPTQALWRWLHEMEAVAGYNINELTINPTDKQGWVLLTARLEQGR